MKISMEVYQKPTLKQTTFQMQSEIWRVSSRFDNGIVIFDNDPYLYKRCAWRSAEMDKLKNYNNYYTGMKTDNIVSRGVIRGYEEDSYVVKYIRWYVGLRDVWYVGCSAERAGFATLASYHDNMITKVLKGILPLMGCNINEARYREYGDWGYETITRKSHPDLWVRPELS